jgi:hypothetical protein
MLTMKQKSAKNSLSKYAMWSPAQNMRFGPFGAHALKCAPCSGSSLNKILFMGLGEFPSSTCGRGIEHIPKEFCRRNSSFLTGAGAHNCFNIFCHFWHVMKCGVKKLEFLRQNSFETCSTPRPQNELGIPPHSHEQNSVQVPEPEHGQHHTGVRKSVELGRAFLS